MIYIELTKPPNDLRDLISQLFQCKRDEEVYAVETYNDKDCTDSQCYGGKMRSFDDVFEIAKTYFPLADEKELVEILIDIKPFDCNDYHTSLYIANCGSINKPTMSFLIGGGTYRYYAEDDMGNSNYKWSELLALVGKTYDDIEG